MQSPAASPVCYRHGVSERWEEQTEEYERPLPPLVRDEHDGREMWCVTQHLRIDTTPVSRAAYHKFVVETGRTPPAGMPAASDDAPVVCVTLEDARAYARWAKKRLPLQQEWHDAMRVIGLSVAKGGEIWEWTASRRAEGHVVRGGRFRDRLEERGQLHHRSWEDEAMPDVGFRCVADT